MKLPSKTAYNILLFSGVNCAIKIFISQRTKGLAKKSNKKSNTVKFTIQSPLVKDVNMVNWL